MKRTLSVLLTLFAFMQLTYAQKGVVKGRITDELGLPLPGASVIIAAVDKGMPTDANGYYTLVEVPAGEHKMTVSFIGYKKIEKTINVIANETTVIDQKMEPGFGAGGEVIVLGDRLKGQAKR